MFHGFSSFQDKLINNCRSSLGQRFANFQNDLSGIAWIKRGAEYAQYLSDMAKRDSWFAQSEAEYARKSAENLEYQVDNAIAIAEEYQRVMENAQVALYSAKTEADALLIQIMLSDYKEQVAKGEIKNKATESSGDSVSVMQIGENTLVKEGAFLEKLNIENSILPDAAKGVTVTDIKPEGQLAIANRSLNTGEAEHYRDKKAIKSYLLGGQQAEQNDQSTKIKEAKEKKEENLSKKREKLHEKFNVKKLEQTAIEAFTKASAAISNLVYLSMEAREKSLAAKNRVYQSKNIEFEADQILYSSENEHFSYANKVKKMNNVKDLMTNLSLLLVEQEKKSIAKEKDQTGKHIETTISLKELDKIKENILTIYENKDSLDILNDKDNLIDKLDNTKDSLKSLVARLIEEQPIKIILDQDLKEFYGELSATFGEENVKLDQRTGDRRLKQAKEQIFDINNREDSAKQQESSERRNSDRREKEYSKTIQVNAREIIDLLS
jgi:hypothetical protein